MSIKITWVLVIALILGAASHAAPVQAAVTIGVSPSVVEISGNAGQDATVEITIFNQGDESFDATVEPIPYPRVNPVLSSPDWLSVPVASVHLEAGANTIVPVKVTFPKDQPSGSRYAGLSVKTKAAGSSEGGTATGGIVVAFLMTVEGNGKLSRKAEIDRFAPVLDLDGRLGFRVLVSDTGNIHWSATGRAVVKKANGGDYGTLDFEGTRIFPSGDATLKTSSTLPAEPGASYNATAQIDYGAKKPKTADVGFTFSMNMALGGGVCENLDRGPTILTRLINAGDLGVISLVRMAIYSADGQLVGRANPTDPTIAWPSDTTEVTAILQDRLASGDYTLTIEAQTGASADPIIQEIPFSIGGTGPNVAPICPQPAATPGT
jgi:hypothetical protein